MGNLVLRQIYRGLPLVDVTVSLNTWEADAPAQTQTTTLRRLAELNDVKPQHDLDEQKTLGRAKLWGWCVDCGCIHELTHDCPKCYAQQPETD